MKKYHLYSDEKHTLYPRLHSAQMSEHETEWYLEILTIYITDILIYRTHPSLACMAPILMCAYTA